MLPPHRHEDYSVYHLIILDFYYLYIIPQNYKKRSGANAYLHLPHVVILKRVSQVHQGNDEDLMELLWLDLPRDHFHQFVLKA
jgi:hypothetical protein